MTREEMQEELEEQDFQYIMHTEGGLEMLRTILFYGFHGYGNYTDDELKAELAERKALQ